MEPNTVEHTKKNADVVKRATKATRLNKLMLADVSRMHRGRNNQVECDADIVRTITTIARQKTSNEQK